MGNQNIINNQNVTEQVDEIAEKLLTNLVPNIIIIAVALLIILIVNKIVNKLKKSDEITHSNADDKLIVNIGRVIKVIVVLVAMFLILEVNGISVTGLIAGFGLIGAVATLAAQDLMKDAINGLYISGEKMYAPGDYIQYKEAEGQVLDFSLRSTKIRLIGSANIMYISNRNISEITILSKVNRINLPLPYELSVERAEEFISHLNQIMEKDERVETIEYTEVYGLDDSFVSYQIKYECDPGVRYDVARTIKREFLNELVKNGVHIPYNKLEIINITSDK